MAVAVTVVGVVAGPAAPGRADEAPVVVTVPRIPARGVDVDLVAASAEAAVLRRWDVTRWQLVGGTTGKLAPILPDEDANPYPAPTLVGTRFHRVVGDELVVTDLADGTTERHPLLGRTFLGASEPGWLTWSQSDGGVLLHLPSGASRLVLPAGSYPPGVELAGPLMLATRLRGTGSPAEPLVTELVLVDLVRGTSETVASGNDLGVATLSTDVLAWVSGVTWTETGAAVGTPVLNVRPTAGGRVESAPQPPGLRALVAFDGGIAYLRGAERRLVVRASGRAAVDTGLAGVTQVARAGAEVRTAISGRTDRAGLWAVTASGRARRIAYVAPTTQGWGRVDIEAGSVFVSAADSGAGPLAYRARVGGLPGGVTVGRLRRDPRSLGVVGRSAGRSLVAVPTEHWRSAVSVFADRGQASDVVAVPGDYPGATLSGPYAWSGAGVTRADGARYGSQQDWPGEQVSQLVGHLALTTAEGQPGEARVRDLRTPEAPPQRIWLDCPPTNRYCATAVVLTGDHLVWARGADLVVRDMRTKLRRVLPGMRATSLLGDADTVVWAQPGTDSEDLTFFALDLSIPDAAPVRLVRTRLSSLTSTNLALDNGVLAWIDDAGELRVLRLPFAARAPRLLGMLGETFSPDDDGTDDVWRPAFDLTGPVAAVRVSVRRGEELVAVLAGTAADGSVRDVRWDGRAANGSPAPDGTYTWTLDAVRAVDGVTPASGTVTLARSPLRAPGPA